LQIKIAQELHKKNTVAILEQKKQYRKDNSDKIRLSHKEYERKRLQLDPSFRLRKNIAKTIRDAIKKYSGLKAGVSILKYLPYTIDKLKAYLEKQFDDKMSWDNHGSYWHIDHIIPQSKLPYSSMVEDNFKRCWALENLQPLEAIANIKKSNHIF
jgi:hypothetical protein